VRKKRIVGQRCVRNDSTGPPILFVLNMIVLHCTEVVSSVQLSRST
jgi:hypothetical protein